MNAEKKENMEKARAYKQVLEKNKKINRINIVVLLVGLVLSVLGIRLGDYLLWAGIFVFITMMLSSIFAKGAMRRRQQ